jgi:hypothetical protein
VRHYDGMIFRPRVKTKLKASTIKFSSLL